MGALASLAFVFFLVAAIHGRLHPFFSIPFVFMSLLTVVMSGSATAFGLTILCSLTIVIFVLSRKMKLVTHQTLVAAAVFGVPAWLLVMLHFDVFTEALNRDPGLTGRTALWADALTAIQEAPVIGHGYRAVWRGDGTSWFPHLPTTSVVVHAHNGYLEIASTLGVPAALAAAFFLTGYPLPAGGRCLWLIRPPPPCHGVNET